MPSPREALAPYRKKRNFTVSPEPSGDKTKSKKSPALRFVVQKHLASHLHYDFRLEHRGVLLSWAVPKGPSLDPSTKRLAMKVEDHPLDYADFEGVIPEGYGAGIVMVWDEGTWTPESPSIEAALEKGDLKFSLDGTKLKGSWALIRTKSRWGGADDGRSWLLIKHRDNWAGDVDVTESFPLSVKSFGDFPDILGSDTPAIWHSHRPAQGGVAGKMLADVIEKAAALKQARPAKPTKRPKSAPKRGKTTAAQPRRPATRTTKKASGGAGRTSKSKSPQRKPSKKAKG